MTKKLLIDSRQPEETRVVLLNGNRIEDFDQETTTKTQNKGNVYLARVTRVEPSLQAAFVEYGGNRQGFLRFNEIHPDYYRIPIEDRKALEKEMVTDESAEETEANPSLDDGSDNDHPEIIGGDDSSNFFTKKSQRKYKIQEVISKRQILLIQVYKEERGNKGAALSTYISLPGRYCVLMPNAVRGGGVSRKINNFDDRKRLKEIISGINLPDGMSIIVRTAGSEKTKTEIKRDFKFLESIWNEIREKTINSNAPSLIYEDGNLIKRTIRDLYSNDVNEVVVEGDEGFSIAKEYIKKMIPSHVRRVKKFVSDEIHLFQKFNIEPQIDAIYLPNVNLKSGGYLVINQTEALVAIDVNSGRATKERNIEETAIKTNLEAAEEVARQLKLRDLSGLIVIDFIDMEEKKNQYSVEKKLKESMSSDRARIQIGRISHFGLLELSRQRLRPSVAENYFTSCKSCGGSGFVRSIASSAIKIIEKIEENKFKDTSIKVFIHKNITQYILNFKRHNITDIEKINNIKILFETDNSLLETECRIENRSNNSNDNLHSKEIISLENSDDENNKKRRKKPRRLDRRKAKVSKEQPSNQNSQTDPIVSNSFKEETENKGSNSDKNKSLSNKIKISSTDKNINKVSAVNSKKNHPSKSKISKKENVKNLSNHKKSVQKKHLKQEITNKVQVNNVEEENKFFTESNIKREASSSQPLDIVDVDISKKKKKSGWWNQSKK